MQRWLFRRAYVEFERRIDLSTNPTSESLGRLGFQARPSEIGKTRARAEEGG